MALTRGHGLCGTEQPPWLQAHRIATLCRARGRPIARLAMDRSLPPPPGPRVRQSPGRTNPTRPWFRPDRMDEETDRGEAEYETFIPQQPSRYQVVVVLPVVRELAAVPPVAIDTDRAESRCIGTVGPKSVSGRRPSPTICCVRVLMGYTPAPRGRPKLWQHCRRDRTADRV